MLETIQENGNVQAPRSEDAAAQSADVEYLAARAAKGERGALECLCSKIAKGVLARARFLYKEGDAEDIAQEALIRMCERIHTLKDPQAFRAWMHRIVTNEVRQRQRGSGRYGKVLYLDDAPEELTDEDYICQPHEYVLREEESRVIMEIIDDFPQRQREAVLLHYYDSMSVTDTAKAMGVTQPNISRYLALAREKMRRELVRRTGQTGNAWAGALALLPSESLMKQAMDSLYGRFTPADSLWVKDAAAKALESAAAIKAAATSAVAAAAAKTALAVKMGIVAVLVLAVFVVASLIPKDPASGTPENPLPFPPQAEVAVVFAGGDETYEHLNPKAADAHVGNDQPYTPLGWAITALDGGEPLQSGEGCAVAEAVFAQIPNGMYRLTLTLQDEAGRVYSLACNFQIGYGPGI